MRPNVGRGPPETVPDDPAHVAHRILNRSLVASAEEPPVRVAPDIEDGPPPLVFHLRRVRSAEYHKDFESGGCRSTFLVDLDSIAVL
jgi:hypothetical protein